MSPTMQALACIVVEVVALIRPLVRLAVPMRDGTGTAQVSHMRGNDCRIHIVDRHRAYARSVKAYA